MSQGESVLLVDMDSQAHCSKGLGIVLTRKDASIRDVILEPEKGIHRIITPTAVDKLDIAPSHIYLSVVEGEMMGKVGLERRLALALPEVVDRYDHIIIDCPPSLGILALNCLVAAEHVIIPMECETYALDGMDALVDTLHKVNVYLAHDVRILGVLATKFRRGTSIHAELLEQLREYWRDKVFDTVIHLNIDVATAAAQQLPLVVVKPESTAGQDYLSLADEVIRREEKQAKESDSR